MRPEILAFTRACEDLLSKEVRINEDERLLIDYYVNEMSGEGPSVSTAVKHP